MPKDKAIKRFQLKKIVDESSRKDIQDNSAYGEQCHIPKLYQKQYYSVSCAIHARVVRVRSATRGDRKTRYTTKIRTTKIAEKRTGGFALVAPSLAKQLAPRPRRPAADKPAAPKDMTPAAGTADTAVAA